MAELGECFPNVTHSFVNCPEQTPTVDFIAVIDAKKYSSLKRCFAFHYILRFIGSLKAKLSSNTNQVVPELSATEVKQAE